MTDLNLDTTASVSAWTIVVSIGLLILAIKFPILFLVNGLVGIGFGLYYLIVSYMELANTNISDSDIVITTILGVASIIIFIVLKNNKTI